MPEKQKAGAKWDAMGITASLLCAVHCIALPFFISTLPFLGIELLHNIYIEVGMVCITFLAGCWAIGFRNRYQPGRLWILMLFTVGMIFLLVALFTGVAATEIIFKSLAALCIVTAHVFNLIYRNRLRTTLL